MAGSTTDAIGKSSVNTRTGFNGTFDGGIKPDKQ
jgi:hypothetical protein